MKFIIIFRVSMKYFLIIIVMLFSATHLFSQIKPTDTDGDGFYNISTLEHLRWFSENRSSWSWDFELDNDINADDSRNWNSGKGWSPIGIQFSYPFKSNFDGNGYVIENLYINRPDENNIGFFGYVSDGATIENLGIVNCDISGASKVGGLIGRNSGSSITNSYVTGTVSGEGKRIGGLIGQHSAFRVSYSYVTATVKGTEEVGGLVGWNGSVIDNSYASGRIDGNATVGGLVGHNGGKINYSNTTCKIFGKNYTGGLVGNNYLSKVINSYSSSTLSGADRTGGLVGCNSWSSINNSYSRGSVSGNASVGGLVGYNNASSINNSYTTSKVVGNTTTGGLVGEKIDGTVSGSYWDMQTSGQSNSDGGEGKTTAEMQIKSTYTSTGWNFDFIWTIKSGYPIIEIDTNHQPTDIDNDGYINIRTLNDLRWLSESGYDIVGNYKLDNDIDAKDTRNWNDSLGFFPIDVNLNCHFEGNYHKIERIYINRPNHINVGFFGVIGGNSTLTNFRIVNCDIHGEYRVGGLVGDNGGKISNSFVTGKVSGFYDVGGLVGLNRNNVSNSYANVTVSGGHDVGGLAGWNSGFINNSYSTGNVEGSRQFVGGLVGTNQEGRVDNSYSTGYVSGSGINKGGLIGYSRESQLLWSFWDIQTSGQSTSDRGIGKSTMEMKTKSTFTKGKWDFDIIWNIDETTNNGYPFLRGVTVVSVLKRAEFPYCNILIYPNPSKDYMYVLFENKESRYIFQEREIAIYNLFGEQVLAVVLQNVNTLQIIDISSLPAGIYFCTISVGVYTETLKMVVVK